MLKGEKVILRAISRDDVPRLWAFNNDLEFELAGGGDPPLPQSLERYQAEFENDVSKGGRDGTRFTIEADGICIGGCALFNFNHSARTCELGIGIGDHAYWGRGYGRDAVRVLLDYGFRLHNLHKIWLTTHSANERAQHAYRACGFVEEGRLREHVWGDGKYYDLVYMGVLRRDWQEKMNELTALSPLDGRYRKDVAELEAYFSEAALYRYRVRVEVEYLIFLTRTRNVGFIPAFEAHQQAALRALYQQFSAEDVAAIVAWDRKVNHDVKAVEYWLRERLEALGLERWREALHFALTSEDVNNLAYALLVREGRDLVLLPALKQIVATLHDLARREAAVPMLARTHGQPATPTTLGKELAVFAARLTRITNDVGSITITGKLNGATGTMAAHVAALPQIDWLTFSRAFVRSLDLEPILLTTQIEPHDSLAALCDALKRLNTVLLDLCQDTWRYISDGYLVQSAVPGEVGSSTMPHKVNPIDFENAEGNLGLANALLEFFSRKLPISRLQRDLSDSTVLRNLGVAFGHSLFAYNRVSKGLAKLAPDHARLLADLQAHPEVLTEAVQTILRRAGYPNPYEALKQLSRGRALTLADLRDFAASLDVSDAVRAELLALTPESYIGLAAKLAHT